MKEARQCATDRSELEELLSKRRRADRGQNEATKVMLRASNRKRKQEADYIQFSRVRLTSRTSNIPISVGDGAAGRIASDF